MTVRLDPWLFAFLPLSWYSYPYPLHREANLAHPSAPKFWLATGLQPSKVEYIAIKTVPDWKTSVTVLKSIREHGRQHHAEQCWCHNTALFDTIRNLKGFRELSIILHTCLHAIMKLPHHCYEGGSESSVIGVITLLIDMIYCCITP